jgi:membrane protease YdiL (CAAX protease family)
MRKCYGRVFLSIAVYSICAILIVLILQVGAILFLGEKANEFLSSNLFIWGGQVLSMYVIAFPILWLIVRPLPKKRAPRSKISVEEFVVLFLISEAIMLIGSMISTTITSALSGALGYEIENTTSDLIMNSPEWVIILVAVVIGPVFEELIFRKLFIDATSRYGDRLAVIASSVSFGIFHGNFNQLIYAGALGLVLGYLYVKTRNILYPILLHVLMNLVGTAPSVFAKDSIARLEELAEKTEISSADTVALLGDSMTVMGISLVQYVLAALGIAAFVIVLRRGLIKLPDNTYERVSSEGEPELMTVPPAQAAKCVCLSVGAILFLITAVIEFVLSILPS